MGRNMPSLPPHSFQPTTTSGPSSMLRKMPRSWLYPVVLVHKSALAPTTATAFAVACGCVMPREASGDQMAPSLPLNVDCLVVSVLLAACVLICCTVNVVGEYLGPAPAPATMVEPGALTFVLHLRLTW